MTYEEWISTPWWLQRIYEEGLMTERPWVTVGAMGGVHDPLSPEHGVFGFDPQAYKEAIAEWEAEQIANGTLAPEDAASEFAAIDFDAPLEDGEGFFDRYIKARGEDPAKYRSLSGIDEDRPIINGDNGNRKPLFRNPGDIPDISELPGVVIQKTHFATDEWSIESAKLALEDDGGSES